MGTAATASEKPEATASEKPDWRTALPSLDAVVKTLAVGGAVLYGSLFLAYRSFYSDLNIVPEELGVNNLYVLARSIGFIAVMAIVAGTYLFAWIIVSQMKPGPITRGDVARFSATLLVGFLNGLFIVAIEPDVWPSWVVYLYTLLLGVPVLVVTLAQQRREAATMAFVGATVIIALLVPSLAILGHADTLAGQALRGERVKPYSWAGVPALDVRATPVTVDWVGPSQQRPSHLFGEKDQQRLEALLIGQGSGVAILVRQRNNRPETIRLPLASVVIVGG